MKFLNFSALGLALLCATATAQDSLPENLRQKATITLMGERGVEFEHKATDGQLHKFTLAGPYVSIYSLQGEAFAVGDRDSRTVGGVLTDEGAAFYGNLTLISSEPDADFPSARSLRVEVFDALVEITTELVEAEDSPQAPAEKQLRPLNQQADFINSMREKARKLRQQ